MLYFVTQTIEKKPIIDGQDTLLIRQYFVAANSEADAIGILSNGNPRLEDGTKVDITPFEHSYAHIGSFTTTKVHSVN